MNRPAFFAAARAAPFGGSLSQSQVDGMNAILDEWDKRALTDVRWLAYMLATTFHETGPVSSPKHMLPVREIGRGRGMKYGTTYYGRGFVQLTWEANYRRASTVVGIDLVKNPDRALELPIATAIMFSGMIEGWFTGKKLADYIKGAFCDYAQARRIINGTDKATLIAGYAVAFQRALEAAVTIQAQMPEHDQPVIPVGPPPTLSPRPPDDPGPVTPPAADSGGFFAALVAFLRNIFSPRQ